MALILENEFVVEAPIEHTWVSLLDLERVATCLPGASIEPAAEERVYRGSMRVKLGPVLVEYVGTARLSEIDEPQRVSVLTVEGTEVRGQGSASATIRNKLVEEGLATRVRVETTLSVTGRPAQFGRGIMQTVAASILSDFATSLSQAIRAAEPSPAAAFPPLDGGASGAHTAARPRSRPTAMEDNPAALDAGARIGDIVRRELARRRRAAALVTLLAALAVVRRLNSRPRP